MSSQNIEVEIKVPVGKKVFDRVRERLKKNSKFLNSSYEIDKYFNAPHRNFLGKKHPTEYLRVRTESSGGYFTYKNVHLNSKGEKTHSDEYETEIKDTSQVEKILKILNFDNYLTVDKKRETYTYKGQFEIALDKVKGLGYFIEIEALKNFRSNETALQRIYSFAKELGIDTAKRDNNGYVLLLLKKRGCLTKVRFKTET